MPPPPPTHTAGEGGRVQAAWSRSRAPSALVPSGLGMPTTTTLAITASALGLALALLPVLFQLLPTCSCSVAKSRPTLCDPMNCSMPGFSVIHCLPEFAQLMSIELVMPSNHLILCCPIMLPSVFPRIRVFSNESALRIRWPKHWSFSFNISPSNEHPGLISFRMDCLHLLAVQGTLKSLLQHHSSKASILQCSAFFIVQLSQLFMTTGKTIA